MEKLKMLIYSPQFPLPMTDGGKIGIANIAMQLSKYFDVTFLCPEPKNLEDKNLKEFEKFVKVHFSKCDTNNSIFKIFMSFILNISYISYKYNPKHLRNDLLKLLNTNEYQILHLDHSYMYYSLIKEYGKYNDNIIQGVRFHNLEYKIWKRFSRVEKNIFKKYFAKVQYKQLKKLETKVLKNIDKAFCITKVEKKEAQKLSAKNNIINIPPGVDLNYWTPKRVKPNTKEIIIATNYGWIHNVSGLKWFIENPFQLVLKKFPETKLTLLGTNLKNQFDSNKNINKVGFVKDVRPYYNKASVFITPLFIGGGIRIKILEAMAMQLPVVSTKVGAEGIEEKYTNGLYVTDSSEDFASAIIDLLSHYDVREEIGKSARKYIVENYSWEKNIKQIADEYLKIYKKVK